jgi:hypothetical protein
MNLLGLHQLVIRRWMTIFLEHQELDRCERSPNSQLLRLLRHNNKTKSGLCAKTRNFYLVWTIHMVCNPNNFSADGCVPHDSNSAMVFTLDHFSTTPGSCCLSYANGLGLLDV